jgi:polyphosphate kinase
VEHSRIYYFRNNGAEEYFISSADAMKRNLEARVEVLCPIESPILASELRSILDVHLLDSRSAWDMQSDGSYIQRIPDVTDVSGGSHNQLIALAEKRVELYRKKMKKKNIKKTRICDQMILSSN